MLEAIKILLSSKRVFVAIATALTTLLVQYLGLPEDQAVALVTAILTLGVTLIGGISVSDHGKAMGQPRNVDHKGRGAPPEDASSR